MFRQIHSRQLYDGQKFSIELHQLEDARGRTFTKEVIIHPGAVVMLPLLDAPTAVDPTVVLIRNYRHAVGKTLLELPAGTLTRGEDHQLAAARELAEETGYHAAHLQLLSAFYPSPGISNEHMYFYLATQLQQAEQQLEVDEAIEVQPMRLSAAIDAIGSGDMIDGKTIACLLRYDRFHRQT